MEHKLGGEPSTLFLLWASAVESNSFWCCAVCRCVGHIYIISGIGHIELYILQPGSSSESFPAASRQRQTDGRLGVLWAKIEYLLTVDHHSGIVALGKLYIEATPQTSRL
jgi:hypothetical protein